MEEKEEKVHRGSFAEGQEEEEHHPERDEKQPRYARGQEREGSGEEKVHRGSFAQGQEDEEHHAESEEQPRFSRGQEE